LRLCHINPGNYPLTVGTPNPHTEESRQRIRAVGEPIDMFVSESYRRNVGYFVAKERHGDEWIISEQGTIFFVSEILESGVGTVYYGVTARHVVETVNSDPRFGDTFLRMNPQVGKSTDSPVAYGDWVFHPTSDVAVCKILPSDEVKYNIWPTPAVRQFGSVELGEDLFCVGMFYPVPGNPRVEAVVRFGRVALQKTTLPLLTNQYTGERSETEVSLIEVHSWGGESGSPVFAYQERHKLKTPTASSFIKDPDASIRDTRIVQEYTPALVGLLHGHYPMEADVKRHGKTVGSVGLNSGIAVMIPFSDIRATLNDRKLMNDRQRIVEKAEQARRVRATPKPDLAPARAVEEPPFTKADFEDALRKVSKRIPKPEQSS
jgi:hypothetical protein